MFCSMVRGRRTPWEGLAPGACSSPRAAQGRRARARGISGRNYNSQKALRAWEHSKRARVPAKLTVQKKGRRGVGGGEIPPPSTPLAPPARARDRSRAETQPGACPAAESSLSPGAALTLRCWSLFRFTLPPVALSAPGADFLSVSSSCDCNTSCSQVTNHVVTRAPGEENACRDGLLSMLNLED
ncbi:unnamed protein product [Lepidochelys kempii]